MLKRQGSLLNDVQGIAYSRNENGRPIIKVYFKNVNYVFHNLGEINYLDNYVNCFVYLGYFCVYMRCVISHASSVRCILT